VQLWDIAGQERYSNMTRVYYREAVGAFVVFDCTRPRTFEQVTKWKQDIDQKVLDSSDNPVPVVLLMVTTRCFFFCLKACLLRWLFLLRVS
jgi:GTPase SAR1 family protein